MDPYPFLFFNCLFFACMIHNYTPLRMNSHIVNRIYDIG